MALELHRSENCGLEMLLKLLCELFPHLGAGYLDFVTEVTKLSLRKDDSVYNLLRKTIALQRRLDHSNQVHPPNSFFHKFLMELRRNKDLATNLSSIFLKYNEHIQKYGPNIAFTMTPYEVYKHLKLLHVDLSSAIIIDNNPIKHSKNQPQDSEGLFNNPIARAAYVQVEEKP